MSELRVFRLQNRTALVSTENAELKNLIRGACRGTGSSVTGRRRPMSSPNPDHISLATPPPPVSLDVVERKSLPAVLHPLSSPPRSSPQPSRVDVDIPGARCFLLHDFLSADECKYG